MASPDIVEVLLEPVVSIVEVLLEAEVSIVEVAIPGIQGPIGPMGPIGDPLDWNDIYLQTTDPGIAGRPWNDGSYVRLSSGPSGGVGVMAIGSTFIIG